MQITAADSMRFDLHGVLSAMTPELRKVDLENSTMALLDLVLRQHLLGLLYSSVLNESARPRDLHGLLRLAQPHQDADPREVLGIYEITELVRLIGVLDLLDIDDPLDPLELRDLNDLNGPIDPDMLDRFEYWRADTARTSLVQIAVWAGLIQRELTQTPAPPALEASDVARLESIAPDFVRRTRRLASGRASLIRYVLGVVLNLPTRSRGH